MKETEEQLQIELEVAKRDIRRLQRKDNALVRRIIDLKYDIDRLLGEDYVAHFRREYTTEQDSSELLAELEFNVLQYTLADITKTGPVEAEDCLARTLFEAADSEFVAERGKPPGRENLINYARDQVRQQNLPPETLDLLTDHRARYYIAERNSLLNSGAMATHELIMPPEDTD